MAEVEIRIKGKINTDWSDWFEGLTIDQVSPAETRLTGTLEDRSAVYGVLSRLSSLGLVLISFQSLDDED